MSLIQCPECKNNISAKATACPNCGFPIQTNLVNDARQSEVIVCQKCGNAMIKKTTSSGNFIGIILAVIVFLLGLIILITTFWTIIGAIIGILLIIVSLGMGGKRNKIWLCNNCGYNFSRIDVKNRISSVIGIMIVILTIYIISKYNNVNTTNNQSPPPAEAISQTKTERVIIDNSNHLPVRQENINSEQIELCKNNYLGKEIDNCINRWKEVKNKEITKQTPVNDIPQKKISNPNIVNDMLQKKSPEEQARILGSILNSGGVACSATTSFFQGLDKENFGYWNVACSNGKSYVIQIENNSGGSTKVLECDVLKMVAGVQCFQKFDNK